MNNFLKNLFGLNENDQEVGAFVENSVSWKPARVNSGETIHLNYHGLLKNSGAQEVFLHYGFDNWNHPINTLKMERNDQERFSINLETGDHREINFCFKDNVGNWDNNNGQNWTLPLQ